MLLVLGVKKCYKLVDSVAFQVLRDVEVLVLRQEGDVLPHRLGRERLRPKVSGQCDPKSEIQHHHVSAHGKVRLLACV